MGRNRENLAQHGGASTLLAKRAGPRLSPEATARTGALARHRDRANHQSPGKIRAARQRGNRQSVNRQAMEQSPSPASICPSVSRPAQADGIEGKFAHAFLLQFSTDYKGMCFF